MQLSKENSDAGAATGASGRSARRLPGRGLPGGPAPRPPAAGPGTAGDPALQPNPPSALESPALRGPSGRTEGTRPGPATSPGSSAGRGTRHPAELRRAAPLPPPRRGVPSPGRRGGARLPGRGVRLSPRAGARKLVPPASSQRAPAGPLLNLQVARRGERACALGLREGEGRGKARRVGGGGCGRGRKGWEGVGLVPGEESGRSRSGLCSRDRDGQPPRGSPPALSLPRAVHRPLAARHQNI